MKFSDFLKIMVERKGSDLFITTGMAPSMKVDGQLEALTEDRLSPEQTRELVLGVMNKEQREEFRANKECNFAISAPGIGRFRVSAFFQRNQVGMVLRRIEFNIPQLETLNLPAIVQDLAMSKRGLILFVGATGTGKSTSLASMLQYRNENSRGHIISIEDPIEFIHQHKQSIVTQREVGIDTESFEIALKNTLRQAPDVIMIGEVRSLETMEYALAFAETGHLCLATLHANNADQALERVIHFFPAERHAQIYMDLSLNLRGIVAQQLIPTLDGKRRAAIEVLLNTPLATDIIRKGEVHELKNLMKKSREVGMQTFDQALFDLYQQNLISEENAMQHADSPNDLRLMIKLDSDEAGAGASALEQAASKFSLQED